MMPSHGSKAYFLIAGRNASQFANTVGLAMERESAEVTTFGNRSKRYIPGLKDATFPLEGPSEGEQADFLWELLETGKIVSFEYYPNGKDTVVSFGGKAFLSSVGMDSAVNDPNQLVGEFQITGDVERRSIYNFDAYGEFIEFNSDDPEDQWIDGNVA